MGTYAKFKNSEQHEKEGVWLDLGDAGRFKLARAGGSNKKFARLLSKTFRPYRRRLQTDTVENEEVQDLLIKTYAKTIVIAWEGVTDEDGNEMQFTVENCIKLFKDLPDLFSEIHEAATEAEMFRAQISEDDTKN
jgi:hypothetical protein